MPASRRSNTPSDDAVKALLSTMFSNTEEPHILPKSVKTVHFRRSAADKHGFTFMVETPPQNKQSHTDKVKRGYVSPSRRGLVPVTAHVPPELRQALHNKYEQSGCDSFNEFMTSLLQRTIDAPAHSDTSANVAEAVEQTRALQKTISKLALDLSSSRTR